MKDLAQLYYSAHTFVNDDDIELFWKIYSEGLNNKDKLLEAIQNKMKRIKRHDEKNYQ